MKELYLISETSNFLFVRIHVFEEEKVKLFLFIRIHIRIVFRIAQ